MVDLSRLSRRHGAAPSSPGEDLDAPWNATDETQYGELFDPSTGLPGRVLLRDRVECALSGTRRSQTLVAVLFVRVDMLEPPIGSPPLSGIEVEQLCAERLRTGVRLDDTVARVADLEFAVVCHDIDDREHADVIASRLIDWFRIPLAIGERSRRVGARVGVAIGTGTETSQLLLNRARRSAVQGNA